MMRRVITAPRGRREGMAVLLVLSIIILLSAMAYSFHDLVASDLAIARKDVDRFRSLQLARAGLNLAMMLVKLDPQFSGGGYTFIPDPIYQAHQTQAGVELTKIEQLYLLLATTEATGLPLENGTVKVAIRDEMARFSLNASLQSPDFLTNLLRVCNVRKRKHLIFTDTYAADDISRQLSNAILDWLDPDNNTRPDGAESPWYLEQKPPYKARNGPFESIDELMLVRYVDRAVLDGVPGTESMAASLPLKDFVTIYGIAPQVNVNSAFPEVLAAVPGIFESPNRSALVGKIVSSRPIRDAGAIGAVINEVDSNALQKAAPFLVTRSTTLRIKVTAHLGSYDGILETVVQRDPAGFWRTLYWKEL